MLARLRGEAPECLLCEPQVNINVACSFVKDVLRGDESYELRLRLISQNAESYPFKDDD